MLRLANARRPSLATPRGQYRAAFRVANGLSPAALARVEAVTERQVATLLAEPDFQELVACLEELAHLPEEERLRQLEQQAWCVLELALADSDWRAAAFIADQIRRGFNPARILAQGVIKTHARAAAPPKAREPTPSRTAELRAARPYDPIRSAISRATAVLRDATTHEAALVQEPAARAEESTPPATAAPAPEPRRPRLGMLAARLCAGTAAAPAPVAIDPRGLLRAWARGP